MQLGRWVFTLDYPMPQVERPCALSPFLCADNKDADYRFHYIPKVESLGTSPLMNYTVRDSYRVLEGSAIRASWRDEGADVDIQVPLERGQSLDMALRNPLLSALQVVAAELLRHRGGYFFHAASLRLRSGLTVMVPGVSGSGKTTFASGPWVATLFSDEHSLLDFTGEHIRVHGVPFSGKEMNIPSPGSANLDLIVFLEKAKEGTTPLVRSIKPKEVVARLLRSMICFDRSPEVFIQNMECVERLVQETPSVVLTYGLDRGAEAVSLLYDYGAAV